MMRGVTQVCLSAYFFHLRNNDRAFLRFENGFFRSSSFCALTVFGEGGTTSNVATAGAPVSPALISPPKPLDLRRRGLPSPSFVGSLVINGVNWSRAESFGKGSFTDMIAVVMCSHSMGDARDYLCAWSCHTIFVLY